VFCGYDALCIAEIKKEPITESQNHITVEAGRHLWRSSCPNSLVSQGHLERVAQDYLQTVFGCISKEGDSTACMDNLYQSSVTLTVKKCFLMFRGNLQCFSLCPLALILSLSTS